MRNSGPCSSDSVVSLWSSTNFPETMLTAAPVSNRTRASIAPSLATVTIKLVACGSLHAATAVSKSKSILAFFFVFFFLGNEVVSSSSFSNIIIFGSGSNLTAFPRLGGPSCEGIWCSQQQRGLFHDKQGRDLRACSGHVLDQ